MTDEIPGPDAPREGRLDGRKVTRDAEVRFIELVRLVATADRTVLVYGEGPIAPHGQPGTLNMHR